MATIYALVDSLSDEIGYIGKTKNLNRRLKGHLDYATHGGMRKVALWIRSVLRAGSWSQRKEA